MLTSVPSLPGDFEISNVQYDVQVTYVADNAPNGFDTTLRGLGLSYSFVVQKDDGTLAIDSSTFDQASVEGLIQVAVTELCQLIAAFNQVPVEDVFATVSIGRFWTWSTPEILAAGAGTGPGMSDPMTFTPVAPSA